MNHSELPIACEGLSKSYRSKRMRRVQALADVGFQVQPGQVCGFLGPNGAGKSTTIKILTSQIRSQGGQATLFGVPVSQAASRKCLGYLPENPSFYDTLSGQEVLRFVGRSHGLQGQQLSQAVAAVLERLSLTQAAGRPIRGYSKGMVQRLGLAQALVHDPQLLILDEPTSGLDPLGRALVKEIILHEKQRGKTVFFSTHVVPDVEQVCDRVLIVHQGRVQADAPLADLQQQARVPEYVVVSRDASGQAQEQIVPSGQLQAFLQQAPQQGSIEAVRPRQSPLEEVFLQLVS